MIVTKNREGSRPRLLAAAALLLGEYLVLSHRVDAMTVAGRGGLWSIAAYLGHAGPIMVTTSAAWFMLFRLRPVASASAPSESVTHVDRCPIDAPRPVPRAPWLLCHVIGFALMHCVTTLMFASPRAPAGPAILWLMAWSLLAVLVVVSALLGVLGGARWLRVVPRDFRVAGPVGLFAWTAGLVSASFWHQSNSITLVPVARILAPLLSIQVTARPDLNEIHLRRFVLLVTPGCSGHEGFGIFLALMCAYLYLSRGVLKFRRAWIVLPLGLVLIWGVNLIRFAALCCVGVIIRPSVAVASFHSKTSWVLFSALAVGAAGVLSRLAAVQRQA